MYLSRKKSKLKIVPTTPTTPPTTTSTVPWSGLRRRQKLPDELVVVQLSVPVEVRLPHELVRLRRGQHGAELRHNLREFGAKKEMIENASGLRPIS